MKQLIQKNTNKWYEVDFNVKYFEKLSKKDEEKIYKILRIISSLGNDEIEEESDKDYRFFTDHEKSTLSEILKEIVFKGKGPKKEKEISITG